MLQEALAIREKAHYVGRILAKPICAVVYEFLASPVAVQNAYSRHAISRATQYIMKPITNHNRLLGQ
jgi:hypothetical protein